MDDPNLDEYFMRQALMQAQIAEENDEVPVGAVVTLGKTIIAKAHNQTEQLCDCTAHAEMIAITAANNYLSSKYLNDCTIYITLEPCLMCAGALFWSQIGRVVFAATDLKRGFKNFELPLLHPKTTITTGILEQPCASILTNFFKKKRV